ncbi:MAG: plastocyanin/azurin family copper-binding protein [Anditalea sp.]
MKKNLFLLGALGLLISCQGISDKKSTAFHSLSMNQGFAVQTVAYLAQEGIMEGMRLSSEGNARSDWDKKFIQEDPRFILIEVVPDLMKFDTDTFTVAVGEKIVLELDNLDGMQHNLLIGKQGTLEKIGTAADAMLRDPKAAEKQYVPEIPEVLFATELLDPGEVFTLKFTAPAEPGNYPFVCTFPGHWRMMNGIMKVEE